MREVSLRFISHYSNRFIIERNARAKKPKPELWVSTNPKFKLGNLGNANIGFRHPYNWINTIYCDKRHSWTFEKVYGYGKYPSKLLPLVVRSANLNMQSSMNSLHSNFNVRKSFRGKQLNFGTLVIANGPINGP